MTQEEASPERGEERREEFGALELRKQTELSISAAAEHSKALIQAKFIVAMKQKRNIADIRVRIIEACKRPRFAEKVRYAKPIGKTKIRGPSVKFADETARIMGNLDISKTTIYEDHNIRKISVTAIDLETNVSKAEEVIIKKTVERKHPGKGRPVIEWRTNSQGERVAIVAATDDELLVKEQALCAKARRNLELQLIPQDIIDEAIDESINTMNNQYAKDPDAAKKKVIDAFFHSFGVKPSDLEEYLRHPIDKMTPAEIADLREVYQSMAQGEASWSDFISVSREEAAEEPAEESPAKKRVRETLSKKKTPIDPPDSEYGSPKKHQASEPAVGHIGPGLYPSEEPSLGDPGNRGEFADPIIPLSTSPVDPKDRKENGGNVASPREEPAEDPEERGERIAMMLGPFVDPEAMPGKYRMMVFGKARTQIQGALEKVGFVMGIKLGFGPKMVRRNMSAGDVSQWLVYLFDYRDEESKKLAFESGLLNIEVIDEETEEILIGN